MRFYDKLLAFLLENKYQDISHIRNMDNASSNKQFVRILQDPNLKRILFDSKQATLFDEIDETPPPDVLPKLRLPFPMFFLEFTEPILIGVQEPNHTDYARAFLVRQDLLELNGEPSNILNLTLFLTEGSDIFVDRSWGLELSKGMTFTTKQSALSSTDPSELSDNLKDTDYFAAGSGSESRHVGWWERAILDYSTLFYWILAYTMAKTITIELEHVSRQVRRYNERHNIIPPAWHIVKLNPKFVPSGDNKGEGQYHHRYRYDVVGHLRFTKIRNGRDEAGNQQWKHVIEWINPHQRGLANSLYIPKTYYVQAGKKIASKEMRQYFGR